MSDIVRQRSIPINDFSGGLNNYWDASSIAQNEVPYLLNMDFSPNGALRSRPPIVDSALGVPVAGQYIDILGFYMPATGIRYLVATTDTKTWVLNTATTVWTEIWAYKATSYVQFADQVILSKATAGGLRWTPSSSTTILTMPALAGLIVFRDRFFGWGIRGTSAQTQLFFSDVISLVAPLGAYEWATDSVINIGRGDGQHIVHMVADYSKIIIFKSASTYALTYSGDIGTTGSVNLLQDGIGAENSDCVTSYHNGYLVLHDQTLYKFMNDTFIPLNSQKVSFSTDIVTPADKKQFAVSVLGDRALVWFAGNTYALNLITGTWSQWESTYSRLALMIQRPPLADEITRNEVAYGITASGDSSLWKIYRIENNSIASSGSESFQCVLKTRIYDFDAPAEWKRLYWWATDIAATGTIIANAYIISFSGVYVTWDTVSTSSWDALSLHTWDRLTDEDAKITSSREIASGLPQRTSLKLDNSLRFRRTYFEIYLNCDGTSATAPAQIFSITPMVGIKAKNTKAVS